MKCIVDTREASESPDVVNELRKLGVNIFENKLEYGDYYAFPVLIERTRVGDFLKKIRTGQLWNQIEGMKRVEEAIPIFLIEGSLAWIMKYRKFHPSSINAVLNSIVLDWDIPVFFSPNRFWSVNWLVSAMKHFQEEKKVKIHPIRIVRKDLSLPEIRRGVLEGIPGISSKKASLLLSEFGTIKELCNAGKNEYERIHGIGEKLAEVIDRVLKKK